MSKTYSPPSDMVANAHVNAEQYDEMYAASIADPDGFWKEQAKRLDWITEPTRIKDVSFDLGNV